MGRAARTLQQAGAAVTEPLAGTTGLGGWAAAHDVAVGTTSGRDGTGARLGLSSAAADWDGASDPGAPGVPARSPAALQDDLLDKVTPWQVL